ncbi:MULTISPECIES: hypothetical protein [Sphingobacterium]|uniref:hypothetical protein n=1 Tax=Sphingobacterium TaxID=28453 RepID=UPI001046C1EC|nr:MULTISPECIES: hypothetical protein [Sphingobacterium]MCW2260161.1 hypothetical protein [Sphingobacterium kitahiroshimense]TCR11048.1 hypothetical protein EDF67_104141 [Sphingobacterium sp. JUb78]
MKKLFSLLFAIIITCMNAFSQTSIKLPYFKEFNETSKKWPVEWLSSKKEFDFIPILSIKKLDNEIFTINIDFGGSSSGIFKNNVVYDPAETKKIQKNNANTNLMAYRYTGSDDYLWTENITLNEIWTNPTKWTSSSNAKIYTFEKSIGNKSVYSANLAVQSAKKFPVKFISTNKQIKGTWEGFTNWTSVPTNSYFELKVITELKVYNFKYFENGTLKMNYDITYNDAKTKELRKENNTISCYKVNGSQDAWVYLLNTTMGNIFLNPDKWSNENNAVVSIVDLQKNGKLIKIK